MGGNTTEFVCCAGGEHLMVPTIKLFWKCNAGANCTKSGKKFWRGMQWPWMEVVGCLKCKEIWHRNCLPAVAGEDAPADVHKGAPAFLEDGPASRGDALVAPGFFRPPGLCAAVQTCRRALSWRETADLLAETSAAVFDSIVARRLPWIDAVFVVRSIAVGLRRGVVFDGRITAVADEPERARLIAIAASPPATTTTTAARTAFPKGSRCQRRNCRNRRCRQRQRHLLDGSTGQSSADVQPTTTTSALPSNR